MLRTCTWLLTVGFLGLSSLSLMAQSGGSSGGSGGSGAGGSSASGGTSGSVGGSSGGSATNSVPSGTGPTPAPTPGQSFTFPSNSGTPGTGTTDNRIPSGTGPTPAPTPGQSGLVAPTAPGSERSGSNPSTARRDCGGGTGSPVGGAATIGGTPGIVEDPNVPRQGTGSTAGC